MSVCEEEEVEGEEGEEGGEAGSGVSKVMSAGRMSATQEEEEEGLLLLLMLLLLLLLLLLFCPAGSIKRDRKPVIILMSRLWETTVGLVSSLL